MDNNSLIPSTFNIAAPLYPYMVELFSNYMQILSVAWSINQTVVKGVVYDYQTWGHYKEVSIYLWDK